MSSSDQQPQQQQSEQAPPVYPRTCIELKILGPSHELRNGIVFSDLPVSITIADLKLKIQQELPSHPSPERQRLIYLGRVLQPDSETLVHFLSQNIVQQSPTHTLHLVFRDPYPHSLPFSSTSTNTAPSRAASSIPRASSVPPITLQNPFRSPGPPAATTPQQQQQQPPTPNPFRNPPIRPGTPRQATPMQNPFSQILQHARIQANVNGVPVNLPPEVINSLLNQQFQQTAFPNVFQAVEQLNAASRQRSAAMQEEQGPATASTNGESANGQPTGPSGAQISFQQRIAQNQQARAAAGRQGVGDFLPTRPIIDSTTDSAASLNGIHQQDLPNVAQPTHPITEQDGNNQASSRDRVNNSTQPQSNNSPGANTSAIQNRPGNIQLTLPPQQFQQGLAMNITGNIPMTNFPVGTPGLAVPSFLQQQNQNQAFLQPNFRAATPARSGTPHANFASMGTPRSISPARSASQAYRRPDQSLQSRIEASRLNVENISRMMDIISTNVNADGSQAHQLTPLPMAQLQAHGQTMMREMEAIGRELSAIAISMPSAINLPDFVQAQQNFVRAFALARDTINRIMAIADPGMRGLTQSDQQTAPQQIPAQPVPPHAPARTHIPQILWQPNLQPTPTQPLTTDPLRTAQDIPLTATNNELRLLTNPAGQPQALLIGPTGRYATPPLPPDIAYALLATQLPHEQLVQVFTNIMRETMNLVSGISNTAAPTIAATVGGAIPQPNTFTTAPQSNANQPPPPPAAQPQAQAQDAMNALAALIAAQPLPAAAPAQQAPAAAPPAPRQNAAPPNNRPPDEMRDILAPYVRMIWLLIRLGVIIYLFTAGGRPSWRLILLGLGVAVVWGIQMGFLGRGGVGGVERVQRYFEQLFGVGEERERIIGEGRRGPGPNRRLSSSGRRRGSAEAASASSSSAAAAATETGRGPSLPSPQETARRLVGEREARNRDWVARRFREVERTVALFVASLWPGVGENVVRVQEQRRREEERVREEEERKKAEEEERKKEEEVKKGNGEDSGFVADAAEMVGVDAVGESGGEASTSGANVLVGDGLSRVNKGKAKATEDEVAAQEVATSGNAFETMKDDGVKET